MKNKIKFASAIIAGICVGAAATWYSMHPITRSVALWMSTEPFTIPFTILTMHSDKPTHPIAVHIALSDTNSLLWDLQVLGRTNKTMIGSRDDILNVTRKLAQYDPNFIVVVDPEPEVTVLQLRESIKSISETGITHFWIKDILWGSTNRMRINFTNGIE
jgi:hypothetical protein